MWLRYQSLFYQKDVTTVENAKLLGHVDLLNVTRLSTSALLAELIGHVARSTSVSLPLTACW